MPEKLLDLLSDSGENLTNRGFQRCQRRHLGSRIGKPKELACAPGCLLAYLAKLLELALVLANSVGWVWWDGLSWLWYVTFFLRFRCHWVLRWDFCFQKRYLFRIANWFNLATQLVKIFHGSSALCEGHESNCRHHPLYLARGRAGGIFGRLPPATCRWLLGQWKGGTAWPSGFMHCGWKLDIIYHQLKCHNAIMSYSLTIYYDKWGHPCGLEKSGKLPATGPRPGALPSSAALLAELRAGRQRLRAIFMEAEVELQGTQQFRWSYAWDCKGHDLGWLLHASSEIFVQGDSFGRSGLENHDEFFFCKTMQFSE